MMKKAAGYQIVSASDTANTFECGTITFDESRSTAHAVRAKTYTPTLLNRNAFPITVTELNVIAALAIIGLRSSPKNG